MKKLLVLVGCFALLACNTKADKPTQADKPTEEGIDTVQPSHADVAWNKCPDGTYQVKCPSPPPPELDGGVPTPPGPPPPSDFAQR